MTSDIIGAKRVYVEMLGDLTMGVIWDWIYFMKHAGADPEWIAKSDDELADQLGVTVYQIRKAVKEFKKRGWILQKRKMWNGAPTNHYHVRSAIFEEDLSLFLRNRKIDLSKSQIRLFEIEETLTSLTPTLDKNKKGKIPENENGDETILSDAGEIYQVYENEIGVITPFVADEVGYALDEFPHNWIIEAIKISAKYNKRSWRYVEAVLDNWKKEGRGDNIKVGKRSAGDHGSMSQEDFEKLANYAEEEKVDG